MIITISTGLGERAAGVREHGDLHVGVHMLRVYYIYIHVCVYMYIYIHMYAYTHNLYIYT